MLKAWELRLFQLVFGSQSRRDKSAPKVVVLPPELFCT